MTDEPKSDVDVAKAAVCEEAVDFYSPSGRLALGRAAAGFLYPQSLTPLELLHSADRQQQMANAGTNAMQAVQKVASWQVRGMSVPVSERIRRLWELTDTIQRDTAARLEAEPPPVLTLATLPDVLSRRPGEPEADRKFRIFAALTHTLADIKGWSGKFAVLAELGSGLAGLETFCVFDSLISEILRVPAGLDQVLGRLDTVGDDVLRLLALADGLAKPEEAPPTPPTARALYNLLAVAAMPETRAVLNEHAVVLACGNEKFTRKPLTEEIAFVVQLKERMGYVPVDVEIGEQALPALSH